MSEADFKDRMIFINGPGDELDRELAQALGRAGAVVEMSAGQDAAPALGRFIDRHGRLDGLINNVDEASATPAEGLFSGDLGRTLGDNLGPVVDCCRLAAQTMGPAGYGRIVNIGRMIYLGWPGKADYCAAKSALLGLTRSLALELAGRGVTVNQITLGDMQAGQGGKGEDELAALAKSIPVQRLGRAEDAALAALYFASPEAAYTTGQTLFVCGGKSIYFSLSV